MSSTSVGGAPSGAASGVGGETADATGETVDARGETVDARGETVDAAGETAVAEVRAPIPGHAQTVLVPLANPDTAPELLALARAVVATSGRVIALVVVLGDADAETNLDRIDAVKQIVDTARARDGRVAMEVVTRPAVSVARGILDATRDEGADLVVLGVHAPTPGEVAVGGVIEQVIAAAGSDVLVYRRGRDGGGLGAIDRVVVGVDASDDSRVAVRLGIILGQGLGLQVDVLHIQPDGQSTATATEILDRAIDGVEEVEHCDRRIVPAADVATGLQDQILSTQLTVVGFHTRADAGGNRLGRHTRAALDTLHGPVLAISRHTRPQGLRQRISHAVGGARPQLTEAEEQSLVWHARLAAASSTDFVVLCVVSAVLATFGLILNSAAVIIGAMLVAPLMNPLVAIGTTLVDGDLPTLRRATTTTLLGSGLVAATAFVLGLLVGPDVPTAEMLSRGSPSFVDAGVAVASGIIGGYAGARRGIPAALAGVAIAAALVPPICVFGLAASSDLRLATGAGLLFITNITCMAAASALVLLWLGVRMGRAGVGRARYVGLTAPVIALVLGALSVFGLVNRGPDLAAIELLVSRQIPSVEVVDADIAGPPGTVTVTVRASEMPDEARMRMVSDVVAERFGGLELRVAVQQLVVPRPQGSDGS